MCNHEHPDTQTSHGDTLQSGCCGGGEAGHQREGNHCERDLGARPSDEMVTCVVRGTATLKSAAESSGLFRDVEDQRYYFCCQHCADFFDAEPTTGRPAA